MWRHRLKLIYPYIYIKTARISIYINISHLLAYFRVFALLDISPSFVVVFFIKEDITIIQINEKGYLHFPIIKANNKNDVARNYR